MRLAGIADYELANCYLDEPYLAQHKRKFARQPAAGADFHRRLPKSLDLRRMFCLEAERVVSNDRVVHFENRLLPLKPKRNQGLGAGARVTGQPAHDGKLRVVFEGRKVWFEEIDRPRSKPRRKPRQRVAPQPCRPPANHPRLRPLWSKNARRSGIASARDL